MLTGRLAKAERGELAIPLPIGYVRRPSGEAAFDPDEQARHVVRLVFGAFGDRQQSRHALDHDGARIGMGGGDKRDAALSFSICSPVGYLGDPIAS